MALMIIVISIISKNLPGSHTYYCISRLELFPDTNGLYDPFAYAKLMHTTSNFLSGSNARVALTKTCSVPEDSFWVAEVRPVKGTRMIDIVFAGTGSNSVFCVASNSKTLLVSFYSTNFPSLQVGHTDTGSPGSRPLLQTIVNELDYWISRFMN